MVMVAVPSPPFPPTPRLVLVFLADSRGVYLSFFCDVLVWLCLWLEVWLLHAQASHLHPRHRIRKDPKAGQSKQPTRDTIQIL